MMAQSSESYKLYKDLDAVKIDYTTQQCTNNADVISEFHFLRLTNKTNAPVSISFRVEYYYNGSCSTCSNDEYQFSFNIPANGSITTDCASLSTSTGRLAVINKYVNKNYGPPLDKFELSNIVVR